MAPPWFLRFSLVPFLGERARLHPDTPHFTGSLRTLAGRERALSDYWPNDSPAIRLAVAAAGKPAYPLAW